MTYELTESERKMLTEFLEECWHEGTLPSASSWQCKKCKWWYFKSNRTFTTAQDMMDLKDKLVEKEEWKIFMHYCFVKSEGITSYTEGFYGDFALWLLNPPRFCWLVKEFLSSLEIKDERNNR